ncbi:transposase [Jhaorihella thermophila]|uniref:Transposase, Mutator family n=1 Tax=Jhaorihella thermophila TaxID=488547 RepID=A0A1H5XMD1_9RHOB|nr:transposase [Jhaorihella thermophila]SEG12570.1 Transposase, Mutator family [Jhaorihella thermophila]
MDGRKDTGPEVILEQLIEHGADDMASVSARAFELAMRIARERFLAAGHYERTPSRRGYANGTKPKRIDTPAGWISVQIPKTAGREGEPFFPQSLERGRRSARALMLAVAEMYIKGVCAREVEDGDARVRHREPFLKPGQPRHPAAGRGTGGLAKSLPRCALREGAHGRRGA